MDRPPIGFVVEGETEFLAFEIIIRNGISGVHGGLPLVNARGCGSIVKYLEEHLTDLARLHGPWAIVVCVDLIDVLRERLFDTCAALRTDLQDRADRWLRSAADDTRIVALPLFVSVVIQVRTFETWLAADPLLAGKLRGETPPTPSHSFKNVDDELGRPADWLSAHIVGGYEKRPGPAVRLARMLCPHKMACCSRSFSKFWREVKRSYSSWAAASGGHYEEYVRDDW